ncbi:GNAT family N-acetyltransferase [Legionella israelensis]|uniref:N-acetyltransferase GCN5 n=1 Tax=Legionella israelensis TaxID=454 RepID=A0A0W0VKJ2_9GAMM|nr:GNAT family N-acetyltransferase [Legionella israelensis]KTD20606.1 N-acetyltransferase GCN5 [Legionella israelensis]QBS09823.1 GNAT family N-acetyltransferase [Legionella israelensis]SCY13289.1 Acetyltransferase (GNAT) family protein [Legionella israelensis DSM 19235]STX59375.1 N-acetyltransferase GCN5 [Legionella israelensis]
MQVYKITLLEKSHIKSDFSCGIEELDNYLKHTASQDIKRRIAAVYVLTEEQSDVVLGFYTLSSTIIPLDELPGSISRKLPGYPLIPATLIGRLALDKKYQFKGLGQILLVNALKKCFIKSKEIASMAVVVEAKNDKAKSFYEKLGFIPYVDKKDKLFITMKTISKIAFDG